MTRCLLNIWLLSVIDRKQALYFFTTQLDWTRPNSTYGVRTRLHQAWNRSSSKPHVRVRVEFEPHIRVRAQSNFEFESKLEFNLMRFDLKTRNGVRVWYMSNRLQLILRKGFVLIDLWSQLLYRTLFSFVKYFSSTISSVGWTNKVLHCSVMTNLWF